jgi:hypothetical protein
MNVSRFGNSTTMPAATTPTTSAEGQAPSFAGKPQAKFGDTSAAADAAAKLAEAAVHWYTPTAAHLTAAATMGIAVHTGLNALNNLFRGLPARSTKALEELLKHFKQVAPATVAQAEETLANTAAKAA